jgi:TM2 domain-containing membrane protein YozV
MTRHKNKTLAAWLALTLGSFGMHRFYLRGWGDWIGWLFPIPTALGWWGIDRALSFGQDDTLSWVLMPMLGLSLSASCLTAIVYALADRAAWNRRYNPELDELATPGQTQWLTIGALVASLLIGTVAFMSTLTFSFQRYFEHQVEASKELSR